MENIFFVKYPRMYLVEDTFEDLSLLDEYDLRMYLKIIKITLSFWAGFNDHSVCFIFSEKDKKRIMDVVDLMK